MKLKTLDLFAGIGGIALGLEQSGHFETVAFCEIDPDAQAVLRARWPEVPIFSDVRTLSKDDLPDIDIITGGFPCQDISLAGGGAGLEGERSSLWFEFLRLIASIRPKAVLIENVSALRHRGLGTVLRGLAEIGYDAEWHSIPASATGAPHRRDRLWIIAYPERLRLPGSGQLVTSIYPAAGTYRQADRFVDAFRERALPFVCGGHDGLPSRVDRQAIKQLGNAVVPEIPRQLGRTIYRLAA